MKKPLMFLRAAIGWVYSPSTTWVLTSKARWCMASASFFLVGSSVARMNWLRSSTSLSSVAQPNQVLFSPRVSIVGLPIGLHTSCAVQAVANMCQPPFSGGSFLARRPTRLCQSIACRSTLKPAWRSSCAATSGSFWIAARSVGFMMTMGVPS